MKKTLSIFLMLIVALSVLPAALAEDDTNQTDDTTTETAQNETTETTEQNATDTEDNENETDTEAEDQEKEDEEVEVDGKQTENETEVMNTIPGAEVRLLQLEKAIARNILRGKEIIKELGNETNTTELNNILAEMEALKLEVQNADPQAEDAVKIFVDLKSDAIDLAKKFRDTARPLMKAERREKLKEKLKNLDEKELKELKEKINSKLKAFNSARFVELAKILKLDEQLLEKIKSGEITAKEAKEQIKEKLKAMTKEERKEVYRQLKELRIKSKVEAKAKFEELKEKSLERRQERLQKRLEDLKKADEKLGDMEKYAQERLQELEKREQELKEKRGRR